jgi:hypothetical protein
VLQQLKEVQAHRILNVADILRLLPVLQVGQVVDEVVFFEEATLSQEVEIVGIAQTLNKLKLNL